MPSKVRAIMAICMLSVWAAGGLLATCLADDAAKSRPEGASPAPAASAFPVLSLEEFGKRRAQLFQALLKQTKIRLEVPDIVDVVGELIQ